MDFVTMHQKRVRRIAEQMWASSPLAVTYRSSRGDTLDDFCTDLQPIVAIIEKTASELDRMDKILDAIEEIKDTNSILVLFTEQRPDGDLWSQGLLGLALRVDQEVEADSWVCPGCEQPIGEGEHFMQATIKIDTRTSDDYKPAHQAPSSALLHARLHNPNCAVQWMADNELLKNVFG